MSVADIARLDLPREFARRLKDKSVIKHLYLYLCAFYIVSTMATSVDSHLLYDKFRVVSASNKLGVLPQERMLANLRFNKLNGFLDLIQNSTLESDVFNDVHFRPNSFVNSLISNEASAGSREELLRILTEEQYAGCTHIFFAFFVGRNKAVILT